MKEQNFVSAVVYARNCASSVADFLRTVNDFFSKNFLNYEIICVDDASEDDTAKLVREVAMGEHGTITLLTMSYYQGLESAMNAGVDLAIGDFVYEFDNAVQSWQVDLLKRVYERSLEGCDIVSACPNHSGHKEAALYYCIYNNYSSSAYKLRTESFRLLSRRAINRVRSMSNTMPYRKAVYANCGLQMDALFYDALCDIPKAMDKERDNQKDVALDAIILYTDAFYKLSRTFSVFMLLVAVITACYTVFTYVVSTPVAGWTTTMMFLAVGFFVLTLTLTIAIRYLSLILKTVFYRHKYVIKAVEKLS